MLQEEAEWLGDVIYHADASIMFPMLNVGSSTQAFRTKVQPWIDRYVFAPARERGMHVIHMDMKAAPGVDIVGDLADAATAMSLKTRKIRSALCSNLLEHVEDRERISALIESVVPPGGYIVVTCPYQYPYHPDPIDTRYRPTPAELASLFKQSRLVSGEIVDCGTHLGRLVRNPAALLRTVVRLFTPFYRPSSWLSTLRAQSWLFRTFRVSCVILQKRG